MVSLGDIVSVLELFIRAVEAITPEKKSEAEQVREALREIYFSDATIKRLSSIKSIDDPDERHNVIGKAILKQRDTAADVSRSFQALRPISKSAKTSIEAGRLMEMIVYGKANIRQELSEALIRAASSKEFNAIDQILEKISELNRSIQILDEKLGHAILPGGRYG